MAEDLLIPPFFVEGTPVPQGSKKAWVNPKTGRAMMKEDAGERHYTWRASVTAHARGAMADAMLHAPGKGPVAIRLTFVRFYRAGDYGTGKNARVVKVASPAFPIGPPDIDKLTRSILDSLTSVAYVDDAQVVRLGVEKVWADRWTEREGVLISVKFIGGYL